jgi:hypothetical protein
MNKNKNIVNEDDELKNLAPFLSRLDKKEPFITPVDYFETLPQNILRKFEPKRSGIQLSFGNYTNYWAVAAVSMVLIAFGILLTLLVKPLHPVQRNTPETVLVTDESTINDLSNDVDESTIVEAVLSGTPDNTSDSVTLEKDDFLMETPDYTKDDLIDYLLNSSADTENITQ